MPQVNSVNLESIPKNTYVVSKEEKKEKYYKNEPHIHKQGPLTGLKAGAHKFTNDFLTYFPKGFQGSKNSDFYEFLSLGMVPYALGSIVMVLLYGVSNKQLRLGDKPQAIMNIKNVAAGTALYALGRWVTPKLSHTMLHITTGIPLDLKYINKVNELPEPGQEKGLVRTQYPGVYDSVQFYRSDLLSKDADLNHGSIYYHDDKIAKKAGFKDAHDASTNQIAGPKIRGVKARATALENFAKYITAGTGVAMGFQKAFSEMKMNEPKTWLNTIKEAFLQLWNGTDRNAITKNAGKAMLILSGIGITLSWLIPTIGFKRNPDTMKSTVDTQKDYEVC
ncbi:MAG: hypothetical protein IJ877_01800 [Candidatus Gastranaerophilales bacterium]|nr:hypothetical protein [Candidatus Gastranaerophilales bacterium]